MTGIKQRLAVDCSVVMKWKLAGEPDAKEAEELLLDWGHQAVELVAPNLLVPEVTSAFLRAYRRGRLTQAEATDAFRDLLTLPFIFQEPTPPVVLNAFEIARRFNQGAFDSIYVAHADQQGLELWTGDHRLYNSLNRHYSFIRLITNYNRKRPSP
jgi:predicted nucleic acid-binding protein